MAKGEPKQVTTMRLSANVLRRLERIAGLQECTRSSLINKFIADGLRTEERRKIEPAPAPVTTGGAFD